MSSGEPMYREIVENNADAIIVLKGRLIVYANQAAANIYGVERPEDVIGTSIIDYIAASDHEKLAHLEQMPFESPELSSLFQFNGLVRDGTPAVFEVTISSVMYEGEEEPLLTIRDVTSRIENENRIRALHRSTALLGMATDWDQVADAVLISLNEILQLSYASLGRVIGNDLVFTHHLGDSTVDIMPLDGPGITIRAISTGLTQNVPDTRMDPSYVSSRTSDDMESLSELDVPVVVNGQSVALINVEDHLPNSFSEDEVQMIEILATHIASAIQRMDHAKQMASIREAHLLEMVGGIDKICERVQGDLKGPIQSIKSTAFLIRHNPELVNELIDNLDNSLSLIEDTLSEMKEITSPTEPEKKLTDVYALLDQAIELSQVPNGIELIKDYTEGFLAISLDEDKIKRVFYNVLRNAIEATRPGGKITIGVGVVDKMVVFEVQDTGSGIPEDVLPNIYMPFFSTKPQSLGLGLSFCRLAVESNGGTIDVSSKVGYGTKVSIHLPL